MLTYLGRRLLSGLVTLLVVVVLTFLLVRLAPGNYVSYMAGSEAPPEYVQQLTEKLGLNRPVYEQLFAYLSNVLRGDLGFSFGWDRPVNDVILSRLPATVLLMGVSFLFSTVFGVILGVLASRIPHGRLDNVVAVASLAAFSMPQFWVGILLLIVFGLALGMFPIQGMTTVGADFTGFNAVMDVAWHLTLPAAALGLTELAMFVRVTRASMLEVIETDFIRTARSKGIPERQVLFAHALRNALLPIVTLAAIRLRTLFAGAILVEAIFAWPGIGSLTLQAMLQRDYPMILGIALWAAVVTVAVNWIADLAYSVVDPRIRQW